MSGETQDQRFAPPRAHVEDIEEEGYTLQLATRGSRLGAALIDVAIGIALLWIVSVATPWNPWMNAEAGWWSFQWSALAGFAGFLLVHGYLLIRKGQTVGKALVRIRIARPDGTAASPIRIIGLRYGLGSVINLIPAAGQIFGLVDALMIFRKSRRCLHDLIADTVVLKA